MSSICAPWKVEGTQERGATYIFQAIELVIAVFSYGAGIL
jgi:hypothetical protein